MSRTTICFAALRVLRIWQALRGHTLTGLSNSEIAAQTGESAPNVTRALATLMEDGWVTRLDNGRYAHSIATLQIAQAHVEHCANLTHRMTETNQRIAAGAR